MQGMLDETGPLTFPPYCSLSFHVFFCLFLVSFVTALFNGCLRPILPSDDGSWNRSVLTDKIISQGFVKCLNYSVIFLDCHLLEWTNGKHVLKIL